MYFPSFMRSKSARRAPRADALASSANSLSQTMSLHKDVLNQKNPIYTDPSTPPSSVGSEVSSPSSTPLSEAYLPLDLPQFPSLEDALPDSWRSEKIEKETFQQESDPLFHDHREKLIGELLEQINVLRNKVRILGDDNSRLRRELTRTRSQELTLHESVPPSNGQPGVLVNDLRIPLHTLSPLEGVKIDSPNDSESSEYSYYQHLEYFSTSSPSPRRNRTESDLLGDRDPFWGTLKRPRSHSLPTPPALLRYSESHPKEDGKPELSPRLIRLIQRLSPTSAAEQYTPEDVVLPFPWLPEEQLASQNNNPDLIVSDLNNPDNHITSNKLMVRRPQSRVRLSNLETIYRCFTCSQGQGHCAYGDGVWLMDRFVNFGYFEMLYYHANLGLWGPKHANSVHGHYHGSDTNGEFGMSDAEDGFLDYVGEVVCDEVDVSSYDGAPSSVHVLSNSAHRRVETYLYSTGGTISEAQTRRERHIALLDSIMEEEELEEAPTSELSEPPLPPSMTRSNSWPRPSRLTQSTLPSIPEQEDSADSTISICPPLTDDSGSSSTQESQSRKSTVTFDDFEDIDFEPVLSSAGSDDGSGTLPFPPVSEVNTVPFPGNKLPAERMTWWEVTVSTA